MLKKPACFIFGIILYFLFSVSSVFAIDSLQNGDFESDTISPWEAGSANQDRFQFTIVDSVAKNNSKSVLLKAKSDSFSYYYCLKQRVSIASELFNKQFKISGYIKTGNNANGAIIRVAWYKSGDDKQKDSTDSEIITSTDWTQVLIDIPRYQDSDQIEIRLIVKGNSNDFLAESYFDDLRLETYDPPTPTPTPTNTPVPTGTPIPPTNTPKPANTLVPSRIPTPSKTPTPKKTPTPAKKTTPTITPAKKMSLAPTKKEIAKNNNVLGDTTSKKTSTIASSDSGTEVGTMLILIGVLFGVSSLGAFIYQKYQKPIDEFWRRKFKKE